MTFEIHRCDSTKLWDDFVANSPQQNIFSTNRFLAGHGSRYDRWLVTDQGVVVLGALVIDPGNSNFSAPAPYTQYQGIYFDKSDAPIHSAVPYRMRALEFLLREMTKEYASLSFSLHPSIVDLRVFQWFNYSEPENGLFDVNIQFTGLISLDGFNGFTEYLNSIRKVRIQEYKKALREGFSIELSSNTCDFLNLYRKTFERQGLFLASKELDRVKSIIQVSLNDKFGQMFMCRSVSGEPVSATLFLSDNRTAYYLFGASDPSVRKAGASTYALLESIRYYFNLGCKEIDMVGVNSPNRGDYKVSLNALPTSYFNVSWPKLFN